MTLDSLDMVQEVDDGAHARGALQTPFVVFDPSIRDTVYDIGRLNDLDVDQFFNEHYVTEGIRQLRVLRTLLFEQLPDRQPFELRYDRIQPIDWESCSLVLDSQDQLDVLMRGWT